jgi:hypothetical protein
MLTVEIELVLLNVVSAYPSIHYTELLLLRHKQLKKDPFQQ